MDLFAHNGVEHTNAGEAVAHNLSSVLILIALVIVSFVAAFVIKRISTKKLQQESTLLKRRGK